ncbi:MAG: Gfo/Idh/MocA family oxidoreductase [Planctomycetota bacterium]
MKWYNLLTGNTRKVFIGPHPCFSFLKITMKNGAYRARGTRLGLVGLGGYAGHICELLTRRDEGRHAGLQLVAMYVPDPARHRDRIAELSKQGVRFHDSYASLLADDIGGVWLPVPIHLHRSMTEAALERGVAVMCEKPVAATVEEVRSMAEASDRTGTPVLVGFQNLYEPATLELKHALMAARGPRPLHTVVTGGWPRGSNYYERNGWAGRLCYHDRWVLDGPASNAMAHFINLAAFLIGPTATESAKPVSIEAELYRANEIESYDTISTRVCFAGGSTLTATLTHACARQIEPTVRILGDNLHAIWRDESEHIELDIHGKASTLRRNVDPRGAMLRCIAATAEGGALATQPGMPYATIETSLAQTTIVNGALQAAPIYTLPPSTWHRITTKHGGTVRAIHGIEDALTAASSEGKMLHELAALAWPVPASLLDLRGYERFAGPKLSHQPGPPKPVVTTAPPPPRGRSTRAATA